MIRKMADETCHNNTPCAPVLVIVVPCYNEEEVLPLTAGMLSEKMSRLVSVGIVSGKSALLFVDDGSRDNTWALIEKFHLENPDLFNGIKLAKNSGHQNALFCGMVQAGNYADAVITMDADLQDDIDAIDRMLEEFSYGSEIVFGVRSDRKNDGLLKRASAGIFYRFMRFLGSGLVENHADFRLMSRKAIDALSEYGGAEIFLRGVIPTLGFRMSSVYYERKKRAAGKSKYTLRKMLSLAGAGIRSTIGEHKSAGKTGVSVKGSSRLGTALAIAALILSIFLISAFSYFHGQQWIDSDHSSEMILGKLLAEENTFLSANWYYSTELRLVYQTLFTMPLFKLLGNHGDWALIRSLNILLNNLALILSYVFMMKQMKVRNKWILLSSFFLLLPQSLEYWSIVTFGGYYVFFIAQVFCCLGLYAGIAANPPGVKKTRVYFSLLLLLSFVLGAEGIRALYTLSVPLLLVCIITREKTAKLSFPAGCFAFISSCAGYAVNCLLLARYSFQAYGDMRIDNLYHNLLPKLSQCFVCLAQFFGFSAGSRFFSAQGFFSVAAIIAACVFFGAVIKKIRADRLRGQYRFLPLFFSVSALCSIFAFLIADKPVSARYFFPFMIQYIPLTALFFEYAEKAYPWKKTAALICGITLFIAGQGILNFHSLAVTDGNSPRAGYVQYLMDSQLEYGFATFWNANVTTELSDGKIEIAGLDPRSRAGRFRILESLIPEKYLDPSWYSGESFLLLDRAEWELFRGRGAQKPDYEDDHFVVIRYSSAGTIYRDVLGM